MKNFVVMCRLGGHGSGCVARLKEHGVPWSGTAEEAEERAKRGNAEARKNPSPNARGYWVERL